MAELVCLDCFTTYDSLIGHYCFNGWWIPGVASRSTIVQAVASEPDSLKKGSTHGSCVQTNETALVFTELVNINPVLSNENYLYNQVTNGNDQQTRSCQDYNTGEATNHSIAMNSELGQIEEWDIGGMNNQARRNELGRNDCNMAMRLDFPNSEMSSNINRLNSMVCQLGLEGNNQSIPSIPNSSNNRNDFAPVSGAIDSMPTYKVPNLDVYEDVESEPKIENDPSKKQNNLLEIGHSYDISISNDAPVINEDRIRINHELIMGIKIDNETAVDNIRLPEKYRQFSNYGQITQRILTNGDLDSMENKFAVTEAEPSRNLVISNNPTHGSQVHTGSINNQVRIDRTNTEMSRHKCTNASTEGKIQLNDMNFRRGTEESSRIVNSFIENSDSFEDCDVDAAHTLVGPSFSEFNEHYTSVCLKDLQTNDNVKRHSMQRNRHLKKHKIFHKGIKQYKCDVCEKSFRRKEHLQRHAFTHTGDKSHECKLCGKKFSYKSSLIRHTETHKVIKRYKCDVCEKLFRRNDNLQTHVLTHTGDKPHECIICGKKFSLKSSLNRHSKTHKPK